MFGYPTGGKLWRFKYRYGGKEKLLALGLHPIVGLSDARQRRDYAKRLLEKGVDPSINRKAVKTARKEAAENSFEVIAREWHDHKKTEWSTDHAATILTRLEKDIFPWIGGIPLTGVTAKDIKGVVDRVKSRGTIEAARRLLTIINQVFTYAIFTDRANFNIAVGLKGYLPPSSKTRKHMAAVIDPKELAPLLHAMDSYQGGFVAQCALKLLPLFFCRPGELRHMEWREIDFQAEEVTIPGSKMKMKSDHIIPLSTQSIAILKELQSLTGHGTYVFPSTRSFSRCMSDNTINAALRRMGFDGDTVTGHGFRATARTLLHEVLQMSPYVIEAQLAHRVPDALGAAYNRTTHISERRKMMQTWADYLDELKAGAVVMPFKTAKM
ncbi:MAG: tyrosine-type recombinase/integrase [Deltaproteobacteria bacterium]|nr:tyrosine-type recombinase/integrase [Deltaproteobacteria bacterium]